MQDKNSELKGIESVVGALTDGIEDKEFSGIIYNNIVSLLSNNPFARLRAKYDDTVNNPFIYLFTRIPGKFKHKNKVYDPQDIFHKFFDLGESLYALGIQRIDKELDAAINNKTPFSTKDEHQEWAYNYRKQIVQFFESARSVGIWAQYICDTPTFESDIIRKKIRKNFGIKDPKDIPKYIDSLEKNILEKYDKIELGKIERSYTSQDSQPQTI
jgi:hypothetical protein